VRNRWRLAFLGVTALAIVMECWASWDGNPQTDPWTDIIVAYVPGEITALVIAGLAGWLAVHFGLRYWRKRRTGVRE
jgi:hypothetical protein